MNCGFVIFFIVISKLPLLITVDAIQFTQDNQTTRRLGYVRGRGNEFANWGGIGFFYNQLICLRVPVQKIQGIYLSRCSFSLSHGEVPPPISEKLSFESYGIFLVRQGIMVLQRSVRNSEFYADREIFFEIPIKFVFEQPSHKGR